jgi:hypothetical protein
MTRTAVIARFLRDEERWLCDTCIGRLMGIDLGRISDLTRRMAIAQPYTRVMFIPSVQHCDPDH